MGRYNPTPLAELPWLGSWCGLWVWPSISLDAEGGQLLGTSQPRSPWQHVTAPAPRESQEVLLAREAPLGRLTARGGRADLTRCQGTKVFFPGSLVPWSWQNHPLGTPAPGPASPAAYRLGLLPDKAGFRPVRAVGGGREAGSGSAMEMNFDPNCKLLPLIYSARLTRFTELTLHPFLTRHFPAFQAPTFDPS